MKIGYPCINRSIGCRANRTFRLKSYSEERLLETVKNNLDCLEKILSYNVANNSLFSRIASDFVPFASHPICALDWQEHFAHRFSEIGDFICKNSIRISMHPDQFTLINSPDESVFERSVSELEYHARMLDGMELDSSAKIQIHVGGVYGDKEKSMERFSERFELLDDSIKKRLAIENDDRLYSLSDCIAIHESTGVPIIFDYFHHQLNSAGEPLGDALEAVSLTWKPEDGIPMVDYSSQEHVAPPGKHANSINLEDFKVFLQYSRPWDFDIMLEIKDKEASTLKALQAAWKDDRLLTTEKLQNEKALI